VPSSEKRARRLLVLGAGRHQTPLILRAEERGIEVVVADYLADSPGKQFASHTTMVDALDIDAVGAVAREYAVDGVVTTGTDQAVVTMAEVAERFGLPQIVRPRTARIATNKRAMKEALTAAGVPMANYAFIDATRTDESRRRVDALRLPVVVKPTDSQGQRGTSRVESSSDLADAIGSAIDASRAGEAVVEEFVDGMEVTASAWVTEGALQVLMVTDRVTYNPPPAIGIAVQHVYPSVHAAPVLATVRSMLQRIRDAYDVEHGPMYVQMLITPAGDVRLVEAACRVGGGHEISLIPLVTCVDLRDRLIDLALTGRCDPFTFEYSGVDVNRHALVNFLVARKGTIASQDGFDALLTGGVIDEGGFYHPVGYEQAPVSDGQGRVGYFVAHDESRNTLQERAHNAFDRLSMRGSDGNEMLFWPEPEWTRG
jgi:biotin carboxylase